MAGPLLHLATLPGHELDFSCFGCSSRVSALGVTCSAPPATNSGVSLPNLPCSPVLVSLQALGVRFCTFCLCLCCWFARGVAAQWALLFL